MSGSNAIHGPGTPLKIGGDSVWRGKDKTNGFLMRNVDGRVPALKQSFSRVDIGAGNVLAVAGAVPYGNALWRDIAKMDVDPGVVKTEKPSVGLFVGVAEFNQGLQTGHPVQGWGIPQFMRSDMVNKGYVGYKVAMTAVGQEANYLAYLQGDSTKNNGTVRKTYKDWLEDYAASTDDGSRLALCFGNASGFPIVYICEDPSDVAGSLPGGTTFGGFAEIFEPENEAIFFGIGYAVVTKAASVDVSGVGEATGTSAGLMSADMWLKLDGIEPGAEKNPGIATSDDPGLMSSDMFDKLAGIQDGAEKNPGLASSTEDGLMSSADWLKLDGLN